MQRVSRPVWVLQSASARCVPGRVCLSVSATAGTSDKPRRKAKKHTTTATPEEQKCDYVGPPDSLSNLRHTRFYVPPGETSLERRYREARSDTQDWNQAFWASHNAKFKTMRQEFIQTKLKEKYGASEGRKTLTADEMSQFYKGFLDDHLRLHSQYNKEWYWRHGTNLLLAARVWWQHKTSTDR